MDWKDLGKQVANFAPTIGGALLGPAGAAVGSLIAGKLGTQNTPTAISAAIADPAMQAKIVDLQLEQKTHFEDLYWAALKDQTDETNQTMRAEIASEDPYVRRARPGFVYALKWTWIIQVGSTWAAAMIGVFAKVFRPDFPVADLLVSLAKMNSETMLLWGPALAVIGIYNVQRSKDKALGVDPPADDPAVGGILGNLLRKK